MPKISHPTLAEHRAAQRAALLAAGRTVLGEAGVAGVTPRAVCELAGLARSSFYDYFATRDDLLVAVAVDAMERWDAEIELALRGVEPGLPRLRALIDATMSMTADGKHDIAGALRDAQLSPTRLDELMVLHETLMRPLVRVLGDLDVADPLLVGALVQGALGAGIQSVSHGAEPGATADALFRLVTRGLV